METFAKAFRASLLAASPTRLEGMETKGNHQQGKEKATSPTRLEGMETKTDHPLYVRFNGSPTRLEGMETAVSISFCAM